MASAAYHRSSEIAGQGKLRPKIACLESTYSSKSTRIISFYRPLVEVNIPVIDTLLQPRIPKKIVSGNMRIAMHWRDITGREMHQFLLKTLPVVFLEYIYTKYNGPPLVDIWPSGFHCFLSIELAWMHTKHRRPSNEEQLLMPIIFQVHDPYMYTTVYPAWHSMVSLDLKWLKFVQSWRSLTHVNCDFPCRHFGNRMGQKIYG